MNDFVANMPEKEYFALDRVSNSTLGYLKKSPAHMLHRLSTKSEPTPNMVLGSLTHCLILEPAQFDVMFAVAPELNKRTKVGKATWDAFTLECEKLNKQVVTIEQHEQALAMANSVVKHDAAAKLLELLSEAELTALWNDKETGLECKARLDGLTTNEIIVDVKTTQDASPTEFARSIVKWGYHRQAAFYSAGYEAVAGRKPVAFVFVVVESSAPYAVATYVLSEESLDIGSAEISDLMQKFKECKDTKLYNGYSNQIETLELPAWYR